MKNIPPDQQNPGSLHAVSLRANRDPIHPCSRGILMPSPKCGSKHFMSGLSEEKEDTVIFYYLADGCGHQWIYDEYAGNENSLTNVITLQV
jgi:hypothetical protein